MTPSLQSQERNEGRNAPRHVLARALSGSPRPASPGPRASSPVARRSGASMTTSSAPPTTTMTAEDRCSFQAAEVDVEAVRHRQEQVEVHERPGDGEEDLLDGVRGDRAGKRRGRDDGREHDQRHERPRCSPAGSRSSRRPRRRRRRSARSALRRDRRRGGFRSTRGPRASSPSSEPLLRRRSSSPGGRRSGPTDPAGPAADIDADDVEERHHDHRRDDRGADLHHPARATLGRRDPRPPWFPRSLRSPCRRSFRLGRLAFDTVNVRSGGGGIGSSTVRERVWTIVTRPATRREILRAAPHEQGQTDYGRGRRRSGAGRRAGVCSRHQAPRRHRHDRGAVVLPAPGNAAGCGDLLPGALLARSIPCPLPLRCWISCSPPRPRRTSTSGSRGSRPATPTWRQASSAPSSNTGTAASVTGLIALAGLLWTASGMAASVRLALAVVWEEGQRQAVPARQAPRPRARVLRRRSSAGRVCRERHAAAGDELRDRDRRSPRPRAVRRPGARDVRPDARSRSRSRSSP